MKQLFMLLPAVLIGLLLGIEGATYILDTNTGLNSTSPDIEIQHASASPLAFKEVTSSPAVISSEAVVSNPFIGSIVMFGGNFAPDGWAFCDGTLLQISQHTALFSILGTTYGGDGEVTFGLPDLRQRVPVHEGNGPGITGSYSLGQKGGEHDVSLTAAQLSPHGHIFNLNARSGSGDETNPTDGFMSSAATDFYAEISNAQMGTAQSENAGGGSSHYNVPPYQAVNYIIALEGIYPSPP